MKWPDKLYQIRCKKSEKPRPRRHRKWQKHKPNVTTTKVLLKERAHEFGMA
jgi:hypothetical protein